MPGTFTPRKSSPTRFRPSLLYVPELLLHVSRGVRWDSDHVITLNDELQAIMQEIVRGDFLPRVHIGLDFFDASINRVAAWVIGTRNALRALLMALLEPQTTLMPVRAGGRFYGAAGAAGRDEKPALRRCLGLLLPAAGCAGRVSALWTRSRTMKLRVLAKRSS